MRVVRIPAFAKVNLSLDILGKRPDGYHELRTVYQTISLHDDLTFRPYPGRRIHLEIRGNPACSAEGPSPTSPIAPWTLFAANARFAREYRFCSRSISPPAQDSEAARATPLQRSSAARASSGAKFPPRC